MTVATNIARHIIDKTRLGLYAKVERSSFLTERIFASFDALFCLLSAIFSALER